MSDRFGGTEIEVLIVPFSLDPLNDRCAGVAQAGVGRIGEMEFRPLHE